MLARKGGSKEELSKYFKVFAAKLFDRVIQVYL